jgi:predicted DNA-binding transcriptional regulator AlpA
LGARVAAWVEAEVFAWMESKVNSRDNAARS